MESGILKCAIVSLQRGKKVCREEIELPNGQEIDEADSGG